MIKTKKTYFTRIMTCLLGLMFWFCSVGFEKNTHVCLIEKLLKNGGSIAIRVDYMIGERPYREQHIMIKKQNDSLLKVSIIVDYDSYFLKYKGFAWTDTALLLNRKHCDLLIDLEKQLFSRKISPTYNCDRDTLEIIHNQTNIYMYYSRDTTAKIFRGICDGEKVVIYQGFFKSKWKGISIGGGFLSLRDELINLGVEFERCKTRI